jgi:hypothetical protein
MTLKGDLERTQQCKKAYDNRTLLAVARAETELRLASELVGALQAKFRCDQIR